MNCFCPLFGSSRILPVHSQSSSSPLYHPQDSSTTHIIDRRDDPSAQLGVGVACSSNNSWWSSAVWWSLKLDRLHILCSHELKQVLFLEDDDDEEEATINSSNNTNPNEGLYTRSASQEESWIVRGVPTRPLYKEFAHRLFQWNQRLVVLSSSSSCTPCNIQELRLLIPAESLGFQEIQHDPVLPSLPPRSPGDIPMWFLREQRRDRDRVIYRVLGIRTTIGSVRPMVHCLTVLPSKRRLLKAATVFLPRKNKNTKTSRTKKKKKNHPPRGEQNCLTVAAKARAKHAGRTTSHVDGDTTVTFFGTVSGPIGQQNREAILLVRMILKQCVWMNCHVLGGLSSSSSSSSSNSKTPTTYHDQLPNDDDEDDDEDREDSSSFVVELRQEQGYGARWLIEREEKQKQELVVSSSTIVSPSSSVGNRKNVHLFPRTATTTAVIDDTNTNVKHRMNYTRSVLLSSSVLVTFRGFLEPHMENGHEQKWRH